MLPDQVDIAIHMPFLEQLASTAYIVLEIGCGAGNGSTRAFSRGLQRSPHPLAHVMVDIEPDRPYEKPDGLLTNHTWVCITGDSKCPHTVSKALKFMAPRSPDVIFIDTDHTYQQMRAELAVWWRVSGPNTVWVFHDTYMGGEYNPMTNAIKEFTRTNPEWEYMDYSKESHGLGLMKWRGAE